MHRRCAGPIGIEQKVIVRETLPNGVKLIAQEMTGFRSVSMAVWIQAGSVYEIGAESGISHFIEHMVFKGTESRSASDIAAEMDAVGVEQTAGEKLMLRNTIITVAHKVYLTRLFAVLREQEERTGR